MPAETPSISPLAAAFLLYGLAFLLHLAAWRLRRPRHQILWLGMIFVLCVPAGGAFWLTLQETPVATTVETLFLYLLLSCSYILTYPAMQAKCPSLDIVKLVAQAGPRGMGYRELSDHFSTVELVGSRQKDLTDEGLVSFTSDGCPHVSWTARIVLRVMQGLRLWLGLGEGEG